MNSIHPIKEQNKKQKHLRKDDEELRSAIVLARQSHNHLVLTFIDFCLAFISHHNSRTLQPPQVLHRLGSSLHDFKHRVTYVYSDLFCPPPGFRQSTVNSVKTLLISIKEHF